MDLWERDYRKALEVSEEMKSLLAQKNKEKMKAKNRAILRGRIAELNRSVKYLSDLLNSDYIKKEKQYVQNETDYKNKLTILEKRKKEIATMYEDFASTNYEESFEYNMENLNDYERDLEENLTDLDKEELLLKQQNLMRLQDEQLDFLEGSAYNLKNISYNINNEINVHNEILDEMDRDLEETSDLLNRNRNFFTRLTRNTSNCTLYILIAILTTTLMLFIIIL